MTLNKLKTLRQNNTLLFAIEGIMFSTMGQLININNNLFATRLGATDIQTSLVITLPQLVGLLVLIPGGLLADRLTNKRRMVTLLIYALAGVYLLIGFAPMLGAYRLYAFLTLLALASAPLTLYTVTWQAWFSDVLSGAERNRTYTIRTKWGFVVGIVVPFCTGSLLSQFPDNNVKLALHSAFFFIAAVLLVAQTFVQRSITGGNVRKAPSLNFQTLKSAAIQLLHDKKYLGFIIVALVFYMGMQSDLTLAYISQIKYMQLDEAWISYAAILSAITQFLTTGFWGKINTRHGVRFSIIFGSIGFALWHPAIIACISLPQPAGAITFLIMSVLCNLALATTSLNIYQCLLQVVPQMNKTLSISIYTMLVSLSHALMPMVGVKMYTSFGSDRRGLIYTFAILFFLRLLSVILWTVRWWRHRNEAKL